MSDRTTARIVGVLFVIASMSAVIGGTLVLATVGEDRLLDAAGHQNQVVTGALIEVILALSVVGIAAMIFPILKRTGEGLAIWFIGARLIEGVFILGSTVASLMTLSLARDQSFSGAAEPEPMADLLAVGKEWSFGVAMISFAVSAVILNVLLSKARLVPSWLSTIGAIGGLLFLVRTVLEMYGQELAPVVAATLTAPIGLSEMVLAGWLIAKGFSSTVPVQHRRSDDAAY